MENKLQSDTQIDFSKIGITTPSGLFPMMPKSTLFGICYRYQRKSNKKIKISMSNDKFGMVFVDV